MFRKKINSLNSSTTDVIKNYSEEIKQNYHICPIPFIEKTILCGITYEGKAKNDPTDYAFGSIPCLCSNVKFIEDSYKIWSKNYDEVYNNEKSYAHLFNILHDNYEAGCLECNRYKLFQQNSIESPNVKDDTFFDYYALTTVMKEWGEDLFVNAVETKDINKVKYYTLNLALSNECNLKCTTCRPHFMNDKVAYTESDVNKIIESIKNHYNLAIGTNGEIFFADIYKRILNHNLFEGETNLRTIDLYTNGTLFNEKVWNLIHPENRKHIAKIRVSIDACTEETYSRVRGPLFKKLLSNFEFINKIKAEYNFELITTYTISKLNVSDVPNFYEFAKKLGIDTVVFQYARPMFNDQKVSSFVIPFEERHDINTFLYELKNKHSDVALF